MPRGKGEGYVEGSTPEKGFQKDLRRKVWDKDVGVQGKKKVWDEEVQKRKEVHGREDRDFILVSDFKGVAPGL